LEDLKLITLFITIWWYKAMW